MFQIANKTGAADTDMQFMIIPTRIGANSLHVRSMLRNPEFNSSSVVIRFPEAIARTLYTFHVSMRYDR